MSTGSAIVFKKKSSSRKAFRRRRRESEPDDQVDKVDKVDEPTEKKEEPQEPADPEELSLQQLQETRELQKLRHRTAGLSHWALGSGQKVSKVEEMVAQEQDPFKLKTGGLLDLTKARVAKAMEDGGAAAIEREGLTETLVGTQFSKETRMRDEDEEMRKFIETEMGKRRAGEKDGQEGEREGGQGKYLPPEEKALLALPDHLRKSTFKKNEEMLSSQMLSGIPEMDLGIEEKIRNIEATEQAKKRLADQAKKKAKPSSDFVPANLAVNFKQGPNRFKTEVEEQAKRMRYDVDSVSGNLSNTATHRTVKVGDLPEETVIRGPEAPGGNAAGGKGKAGMADKATDDLHLSKFKSHFHRK